MLSQLSSILRNAILVAKKPGILKRGGNPLFWAIQRTVAEWKFESEKVGEAEFVTFLTGHHSREYKPILEEMPSTAIIPVLYLLVKTLRPDIVIETGVAAGHSSASILTALEENGSGRLYSIDLPSPFQLEDGNYYGLDEKEIGRDIPPNLRRRWELLLGDARKELPDLLAKLGVIDIFIHDSLHTEKHMMWEYETAWPFLKPGGVLLSHDISVAFLQFTRYVRRTFRCCGLYSAKYGGITK